MAAPVPTAVGTNNNLAPPPEARHKKKGILGGLFSRSSNSNQKVKIVEKVAPPAEGPSQALESVKFSGRLFHEIEKNAEGFAPTIPVAGLTIKVCDDFWHGYKEITKQETDNEGGFTFVGKLGCEGQSYNFKVLRGKTELDRIKVTPGIDGSFGNIFSKYDFQPLDPSIMGSLPADKRPEEDYLIDFAKNLFPEIGAVIKATVDSMLGQLENTLKSKLVSWFSSLMKFFGMETYTAADVQAQFDATSNKYPQIPATKENLLKLLLNSVAAVPATKENGRVKWETSWDRYEKDKTTSLVNITVEGPLDQNGYVTEIDRLVFQFGEGAPVQVLDLNNPPEDFKLVIPGEKTDNMTADERLAYAVRYAISMFTTLGEASEHLNSHLVTGLYEQTFDKTIAPTNPFRKVLDPHYDGTRAINKLGSLGIIFGQGSILELGGLSANGLKKLIIDWMANKWNWESYKPRDPLGDRATHYLAHFEKDVYEGMLKTFRGMIDEKWNDITELNNWTQLYRWSELTNHQSKIRDDSLGIDTTPYAIPMFIDSKLPPPTDNLEAVELAKTKLTKVLAFNLTQVFLHHMAHTSQEAAANIFSGWLSPENWALTEDGHFALDGNTTPEVAIRQNFVSRFLLEFDGEKMTGTQYGIDSAIGGWFRKFIEENKQYYPKLVDLMRSIHI